MSARTSPQALFIERAGKLHFQGQNARGAQVEIGYEPGQWSPGELLKIALVGCGALSADSRLARALGENYSMRGAVDGEYNKPENRYESFTVDLIPDFGDLPAEEVADLIRRALGAVDRQCTVSRTVEGPVRCETIIVPNEADKADE